jgi:hypothetical protein
MHQHTKTDDGQRTALEELWQFTPERITRYRANPKSFRDGGDRLARVRRRQPGGRA